MVGFRLAAEAAILWLRPARVRCGKKSAGPVRLLAATTAESARQSRLHAHTRDAKGRIFPAVEEYPAKTKQLEAVVPYLDEPVLQRCFKQILRALPEATNCL